MTDRPPDQPLPAPDQASLPYPVTLDDMVVEARRELEMRKRVYGKAKLEKRMNARQADRRIDVQAAIVRYLEGRRDAEMGERDKAG